MLTDEIVLAAYVDGSDLDSVAPTLRTAFANFALSGAWPTNQVLVVDQRQPPDSTAPDFLPQWDLGLNLGLDHRWVQSGWFDGVERLVKMLQNLAGHSGREFVLFVCFRSEPWRQEHLDWVGCAPVDLVWLRQAMERLPVKRKV
jgi:hypothetical protein